MPIFASVQSAWLAPFLPAAAAFAGGMACLLAAGRRPRRWERAEGVVVESRVEPRGSEFAPVITFEFEAGGERRRGTALRDFPVTCELAETAADWTRRHPPGLRVGVHFPENDPARACLLPGGKDGLRRGLLALSALFFAFAVLLGINAL